MGRYYYIEQATYGILYNRCRGKESKERRKRIHLKFFADNRIEPTK